ncbi:MAG: hypothetical protein J2P26_06580 [Nocardiopsaceae bacterium]|nr:hypothetical protein [Nocardiopsaceae bacterium]
MRVRTVGAGGVAALGAGVMLAACAPVQMGAAAITGDQRITQSTLAAKVSDLRDEVAKYPAGEIQLQSSQMPQAVLGWLVRFAIEDRAARTAGVSVTSAEIQQGVAAIGQQAQQYAAQSGLPDATAVLLSSGVGPQMITALGRYQAQELSLAKKANGGKLPTTQAETDTVTSALSKGDCLAAKSLNIRINPQYGRLDYSQYTVVPGQNLLSKTVGAAPEPATGAKPAC